MTDRKTNIKWRFIALAIALGVVLLDRISKILAVRGLVTVGNGVTVIPGVLDFTYVRNSGATAGMLSDRRWIFMVASTVVIIGIGVWIGLGKVSSRLNAALLAAIVGGGIGNMIDRIFEGAVVDFIDVTLVDFFPFNTVFNVADMFVSLGCVALIVSVVVGEIKAQRAKKGASDERS